MRIEQFCSIAFNFQSLLSKIGSVQDEPVQPLLFCVIILLLSFTFLKERGMGGFAPPGQGTV